MTVSRPLACSVLVVLALVVAPGGRADADGGAQATPSAPREWRVGDDLVVRRLGPGSWLHTSFGELPDGSRFPSNGLVVRDGDELVLVDTAWGEGPTEALLDWIAATLEWPLRRAIATHGHADRIGGASVLRRRGVALSVHPDTARRAAGEGLAGLASLPDLASGEAVRIGALEVFYPGPAHTPDNVLVWVPAERLLFGGCAVKDKSATTLGNVADADVARWPAALRAAQARYGEVAVVVPGHGEPGGVELLEHTLALLARAPRD